MSTQRGFADINGASLCYEVAGTGHPLIFIHGFTLDTRMWDDEFDVFAQHYQVMRYDARGFGQSSVPGSDAYSHVDDLCALMALLDIAHAHVIGLSMGGGLAIDFAVAHPDMADTLIPVDALLPGYQWRGARATAGAIAAAKAGGIEAAKADLSSR